MKLFTAFLISLCIITTISAQRPEEPSDSIKIEMLKMMLPNLYSKIKNYKLRDSTKLANYTLPYQNYNPKTYSARISDTIEITIDRHYKMVNGKKQFIVDSQNPIFYKFKGKLKTNKNLNDRLRITIKTKDEELNKRIPKKAYIYKDYYDMNFSYPLDSINFNNITVDLEKVIGYDTLTITKKDISKEFTLGGSNYKVEDFHINTLELIKYDSIFDFDLYSANFDKNNNLVLSSIDLKEGTEINTSKLYLYSNDIIKASTIFLSKELINSDPTTIGEKIESLISNNDISKKSKDLAVFIKFPNNVYKLTIFVPIYEKIQEVTPYIKYKLEETNVDDIQTITVDETMIEKVY